MALHDLYLESEKTVKLIQTLMNAIKPFLDPSAYEQVELRKRRKEVKEIAGNHVFGRMKFVRAMLELDKEPCSAAETELKKWIAHLIPLRTVKEAWKIVTDNSGLIKSAIKIIGPFALEQRQDAAQHIRIQMWLMALYWNEKNAFSTYFLDGVIKCKRDLMHMFPCVHFKTNEIAQIMNYLAYQNKNPNATLDDIRAHFELSEGQFKKLHMMVLVFKNSLKPLNAESLFGSLPPTYRMGEGADGMRKIIPINEIAADYLKVQIITQPPDLFDSLELSNQTKKVLASLLSREEEVLRSRFGIGKKMDKTCEETATEFGVGRERIRQIELKALRKIRHPLRSKRLKTFL